MAVAQKSDTDSCLKVNDAKAQQKHKAKLLQNILSL